MSENPSGSGSEMAGSICSLASGGGLGRPMGSNHLARLGWNLADGTAVGEVKGPTSFASNAAGGATSHIDLDLMTRHLPQVQRRPDIQGRTLAP